MLLRFIPVLLSGLLLAAHFIRGAEYGLAAICLVGPFLLLSKSRWVLGISQVLLLLGAGVWLFTLRELIVHRIALNEPWFRLACILSFVILFTLFAVYSLRGRFWQQRNTRSESSALASGLAFLLTGVSLATVQLKVVNPMLLAERFWPGGGWIELFSLSVYAAHIAGKMQDRGNSGKLRRRIWFLFTLVFFGQLLLGLVGFEQFLMTGKLHLPVPALIAAGPVYRGTRFFMPILFGVTLLLVGPAWCSYLCYFGSLDNLSALKKKRPRPLPRWTKWLRIGSLVVVIAVALLLRLLGASPNTAAILGGVFGILGLGVILLWSSRSGVMVHCTVYCPIGLLANALGKLSPFRLRIGSDCNECGACTRACRYDALNWEHISQKKPGWKCTLCGDCLGRCKDSQLAFSFLNVKGDGVRLVFLAIVVALHSIFLGVARI